MDDALRSFDGVLAVKPTNLVALLGKVVYVRIILRALTQFG
jgi:RNA polymerase-associated protein CTR9